MDFSGKYSTSKEESNEPEQHSSTHSTKTSPHTSAAQQELSASTLQQTNIPDSSSFHSPTGVIEQQSSAHSTKTSPHVSAVENDLP